MLPDNRIENIFDEFFPDQQPKEGVSYITKTELVEKIKCDSRTPDFYVRQGLLKKPIKQGKEVAWEKEYIIDEIRAIKILNSEMKVPLTDLSTIAKSTNYQLAKVAVEADHIALIYFELTKEVYDKYFRRVFKQDRFKLAAGILKAYIDSVLDGKLKSDESLQKFIRLVEKDYTPKITKRLMEDVGNGTIKRIWSLEFTFLHLILAEKLIRSKM